MSVVDRAGNVLLDELVRQERPVTDYLTEFSGMSAGLLDGVQTTLSDVQARLRDMLWRGSILVGHSLENDLRVLRLYHPRIIDTAVWYKTGEAKRRNKQSLLVLADRYLDRRIQCNGTGTGGDHGDHGGGAGHDSVEDATTALDLALRLLIRPPRRNMAVSIHERSFCALLRQHGHDSLVLGPMKCGGPHVGTHLMTGSSVIVSNHESDTLQALNDAATADVLPALTWASLAHVADTGPATLATLEAQLASITAALEAVAGTTLLCVVGTPGRGGGPGRRRPPKKSGVGKGRRGAGRKPTPTPLPPDPSALVYTTRIVKN